MALQLSNAREAAIQSWRAHKLVAGLIFTLLPRPSHGRSHNEILVTRITTPTGLYRTVPPVALGIPSRSIQDLQIQTLIGRSGCPPCHANIDQLTDIEPSLPPLPHRAGCPYAGCPTRKRSHPRPGSVFLRAHEPQF